MAPEQVRRDPAAARSDIFAFGAVLYEMLCGRLAFGRGNASDTTAAILRDDPRFQRMVTELMTDATADGGP
jgi:serine/threonine protein kinase